VPLNLSGITNFVKAHKFLAIGGVMAVFLLVTVVGHPHIKPRSVRHTKNRSFLTW
jgi:hypothetical protein